MEELGANSGYVWRSGRGPNKKGVVGKTVGKKFREKRAGVIHRCAVRSVEESAIQVKDEEESLRGQERDWGDGGEGEIAGVGSWNREML